MKDEEKNSNQKISSHLETIRLEATQAFHGSTHSKELYDKKVHFLGKSGVFTEVMKEMSHLSKEERPAFGKKVNEIKQQLERVYLEVEGLLKDREINQKMLDEKIDLTLPGFERPRGAEHPVQKVMDEILGIMSRVGYSIRTGPIIEKDYYNFEALNIPSDHPARDMQDTFFIDQNHVLRTHTSPIQIHALEGESLPLRVLGVGAVFRCDSDISHLPHFHQIEALCVDRRISMADLKGTISFFVKEYFGSSIKTRFRPSYFPFTEPSAEVDCSCPICKGKGCSLCKQTGWIEIGGSGLVNPKVFQHAKIDDSTWQGFAFGFGVERMAIIKYGIEDIRLFPENDIRFLRQF